MIAPRQRAEDFLELVERARRGRLKIYLGFAAGVGKTYRMLEEAHALRKRGVNVVVGFVEPHGREETSALLRGLEVVPRKLIEYRGVTVEEMDLDAVIARRPQVAIVDEVAHTNAPGSKNRKRYEDIVDLLEAGINVIAAFNVQHLESLKDLVERATGVKVHETVPDTFLKKADQVVTLDLAVEDLLERLRAGKIYREEKIALALENFFKEANLATLRELVLREVAESVERAATATARAADQLRPREAVGRILVCISSQSPRAPKLLRRASRMAGRFNTDWYAVYVETPEEAPDRIDSGAQRQLHTNIQIARDLGAEVVRLKGHDPVAAILDFARTHGVRDIVAGRSHRPWWRLLLGRDVVSRLVAEAAEFDVHVVSVERVEREE
jgi:two-component system sensor histidine kinase KdpD